MDIINTFEYPKDFTKQSCFSTGDSGSLLMVTTENYKRSIEGILSFFKGCEKFDFGEDKEEFSTTKITLQHTPSYHITFPG